ncbi:unnamed protein product [Onchocerca flexuosa]|uniref:Uncharacterized protein n=1 Tax=Onchocerca flexuosa TaxID=387005 RepID=A0A183HC70_9BILA|nr:unnamed protein product [Onchocerca flexuosa]
MITTTSTVFSETVSNRSIVSRNAYKYDINTKLRTRFLIHLMITFFFLVN